MGGSTSLLQPVEAIAVPLSINQVQLAVMVYVIAKNRKTRIAQVPVAMPFPLVFVRVDLLKPSMCGENVRFAIAIDVRNTDAVAVLLASAQMMHGRLVL